MNVRLMEAIYLHRGISQTAVVNDEPDTVTLPRDQLATAFRVVFEKYFDEEWYLKNNKDVKAAMDDGQVSNALGHYLNIGIYEGRLPCSVLIDEEDYLTRHSDVAAAVESGGFESAAHHFYSTGFGEGRFFRLADS